MGVRDADEAAGPGFVHGHFGDEGDAHAGADHGQEAGKVAAFEDDAGIEAATELCEKVLAEGAPGLHFITFNFAKATREVLANISIPARR